MIICTWWKIIEKKNINEANDAPIPNLTFSHTTNRPLICIYEQLIAILSKEINIHIWIQNNKLPAGPTVPNNTLIKIINEIDNVDFIKEESANSSQVHTIIKENCKGHLKSIMGGAGGRFIIDEFRRGSDGIMPSGHMLEAHRVLWDSCFNCNYDRNHNRYNIIDHFLGFLVE